MVFRSWCIRGGRRGVSHIHAIFNAGQSSSSFYTWHIQSVYFIFVLRSICLSSSLVNFKNYSEYLTRRTTQEFIPLIRFQQQSLISRSFLFRLKYSFLFFFFFFPLHLRLFDGVGIQYSQVLETFLFSKRSDFTRLAMFTIRQVFCFYWLSLSLVVWPRLGDMFVLQNPRELLLLLLLLH